MLQEPEIITGGKHADDRGEISFVNDFRFKNAKRFYTIEHPDQQVTRAWQAHQKENKWFYVVTGSFLIAWVKIDDWKEPSIALKASHHLLQANKSEILHLPGGYANGFRALTPHSKLIVFSDFTVEESAADNYRFDKDLWFDWNAVK
jgi:dTDP-4-dehydrorhamnose 3,5-epimerase-like enzyme